MVNLNKIEMMLSKLQQPLDIDFICKNILKVNEDEGRKILNTFIEKGIIDSKGEMYRISTNKK